MSNLDAWEATLVNLKILELRDLRQLIRMSMDILIEESNIPSVSTPVTICGDIHGQFPDLLHLFDVAGSVSTTSTNYVFLGDLVDRGYNSIEVLSYLLVLKCKYPNRVWLIRGNHETRQVTTIYGFFDECNKKYPSGDVWKICMQLFDCFPLAALIDGKGLCVHGGLSPELPTIDQFRVINRRQEIPSEGPYCDLVWSDPENVEGWVVSQRGAGYLFGAPVTREFLHLNGLNLIARAHQLVQEGYKYHFDEHFLVTVWSAPNYCYRCSNLASVLRVHSDQSREFVIFREVERQVIDTAPPKVPSFM